MIKKYDDEKLIIIINATYKSFPFLILMYECILLYTHTHTHTFTQPNLRGSLLSLELHTFVTSREM